MSRLLRFVSSGEVFRHYKGEHYKVMAVGQATANLKYLDTVVVHANSEHKTVATPLRKFHESLPPGSHHLALAWSAGTVNSQNPVVFYRRYDKNYDKEDVRIWVRSLQEFRDAVTTDGFEVVSRFTKIQI